jgi:hypothetical protein
MATIHINIPDQQAAALEAYVRAQGLTLEQWFLQVAEKSVPVPPSEAPAVQPARPHISEVILERMSKVPHEIMATMPVDGASQHDHYIYGLRKRD